MKSLAGKKVLITRPERQASSFIASLEKHHATPLLLPTIAISASDNREEKKSAISSVDRYDWIIFTSTNAVRFFFEEIDAAVLPEDLNIAAVGKKTKAALEKKGIETDFMPDSYTAEALTSNLPVSKAEKILYPMSEKADDKTLKNIAKEKGAVLTSVVFYQNRAVKHAPEKILEIFDKKIDFITFTSGSAAKALASNLRNAGVQIIDEQVICIGPKTALIAEEAGFWVDEVAEEHTVEGMIHVMRVHS